MPLVVEKSVAALGGRGAWAPMVAKAKAKLTPPEFMQLPIGVYGTPLVFLWHSRDKDTTNHQQAGMVAAVFAVLAAGNYVKLKYDKRKLAAEENNSTKKKKGAEKAKKAAEKKQK